MLMSIFYDYRYAYILVKGAVTVVGQGADAASIVVDKTNKEVIFKNSGPSNNCISKIPNTQADNAKDLDVVMRVYDFIEYSNNYSKTLGRLWQYCLNHLNWNWLLQTILLMMVV